MVAKAEASEVRLSEKASAVGLRVLVVTNMYPSPTVPHYGKFVERQVKALEARGYEQDVLVIDGSGSRLNYLRGIVKIRHRLQDGKHDIVHAYFGLSGFISMLQRRVPVVTTFCGSDLNPGYAGNRRAPMLSLMIRLLSQAAALGAKVNIVRSQRMRDRLIGRAIRQRARVIPSGVDLGLFRPVDKLEARKRLGWDANAQIVIFVCSDPRIPAVKRPELAKAVLEKLREMIPTIEMKVISGKSQAVLADCYSGADVLLLTSAQEGSPNVVKEAVACDLPVVSTDVGDVQEIVRNLDGCQVCSHDRDELAKAVMAALRHGRLASGRKRAEYYGLATATDRISEIYLEVGGRKKAGNTCPEVGTGTGKCA